MRAGLVFAIFLAILSGTALPACASEGFDIVVPGRPGVPIIINGVDASYSVVEGEFGLDKGYHGQPWSMAAAPSIPSPMSVTITRASATSPAMAVSRSSRRRTASCRSRPRAFTSHGPRNPRRRRCPGAARGALVSAAGHHGAAKRRSQACRRFDSQPRRPQPLPH